MKALAPLVKQRKDSVEQFKAAINTELADKEQAELDIISTYLAKVQPRQLTKEEMETIAKEMVAAGASQIGHIMSEFKSTYEGRYDGRELSALAKSLIS